MIINPTIGRRVRCIEPTSGAARKEGIISCILDGLSIVQWRFDHSVNGQFTWYSFYSDLEYIDLTLEQQDQQRRKEYATKYL